MIIILSYLGMIVQAHFNMEEQFSLVLRLVSASLPLFHLQHKGIWQSLVVQCYDCKAVTPLLPGFLFCRAIAAGSGVAFWIFAQEHRGEGVYAELESVG